MKKVLPLILLALWLPACLKVDNKGEWEKLDNELRLVRTGDIAFINLSNPSYVHQSYELENQTVEALKFAENELEEQKMMIASATPLYGGEYLRGFLLQLKPLDKVQAEASEFNGQVTQPVSEGGNP
jgi:hypothetical protein